MSPVPPIQPNWKAIQVTDYVKFKPQLGRKYFEVDVASVEKQIGRPREEWAKIAVGIHPHRNNTIAVFVVVDGNSEVELARDAEQKAKLDETLAGLGQRKPLPAQEEQPAENV